MAPRLKDKMKAPSATSAAKTDAGSKPARNHRRSAPPVFSRLGSRLRARRLELGRTLQSLTDETGIRPGRLSQFEFGTLIPGPEPLARIATALEEDIHRLWRLRASTLIAIEISRFIRLLRLLERRAVAIVERSLSDESVIRTRRIDRIE